LAEDKGESKIIYFYKNLKKEKKAHSIS